MWAAKVYFLAIIIAFFSGAWPYIKLFSMMFSWFAPLKVLSVERRETLLIVLDALGKWSLVDFFVMILFLCAFYLQLGIGPDNQIMVDVTVKPGWGFYGFLLATMISLGLSHIILACHRLIVEPKVLPIPDMLDPKESLSSIVYEIKLHKDDPVPFNLASENSTGETAPLVEETDETAVTEPVSYENKLMCIKFTYFGKACVGFTIVLTALFIVGATFVMTMGFEFKGLTGYMLKSDDKIDYSYVSIGDSIPEHSGIPDDFGVRWMQAAYFLFGLAMPLGLMLVLMILWFVPLTLGWQRTFFVLSEVLNAWSALDVFCLAIAAALLEIHQFAMFIVGDSCDKINSVLAKYMDDKLEGDDKCFDVIAYLKSVRILSNICFHCFLSPLLSIVVLGSFLWSNSGSLRWNYFVANWSQSDYATIGKYQN
jgi:small basic protein